MSKTLKRREQSLRAKYNLTLDDYAKILSYQGGVCAICGRPPSDFKNSLAVDHDHHTRLVRGILCWGCNDLLPNRKELESRLYIALGYLRNPPALLALGGPRYANPMRRRKKK